MATEHDQLRFEEIAWPPYPATAVSIKYNRLLVYIRMWKIAELRVLGRRSTCPYFLFLAARTTRTTTLQT